jgi:hypothetical protein
VKRLVAALLSPIFMCSAVVLSSCSSSRKTPSTITSLPSTSTSTSTSVQPGPPAPLTGIPGDPQLASRPAVIVKIDNSPGGRPQSGLGAADVIVEEKVEGGVSRFLAVFHSHDAKLVGPIRSVRSSDPPIVTPFGGLFAYSGGIPAFVSLIRKAGLSAISESDHGGAFHLLAGRHRPYATFGSTSELRTYASKAAKAPPAIVGFLEPNQAFSPTGSSPAAHATVRFGKTQADWQWDATIGKWLRYTDGTAHMLADGTHLACTNVVIQTVGYQRTQYKDPSGAQVDRAIVLGSGKAIVLSGGRQLAVTWSKPTASAVTTYTDAGKLPVRLTPGNTCIQLPPTGLAPVVS